MKQGLSVRPDSSRQAVWFCRNVFQVLGQIDLEMDTRKADVIIEHLFSMHFFARAISKSENLSDKCSCLKLLSNFDRSGLESLELSCLRGNGCLQEQSTEKQSLVFDQGN